MNNAFIRVLSLMLGVTALVLLLVSLRLSQRGKWIPETVPVQIGAWYASNLDLNTYTRELLGNPPTLGRRYSNPFNERVELQVVATSSYETYLEPQSLWGRYGYALTAEKTMEVLGSAGPVRAMIFQNIRDGSRLLLYQWIQFEDGTVTTRGYMRDYRDILTRFNLGFKALTAGKQSCIVRVFTQIHPADPNGLQARRNINAVSKAIYESLRQQGNDAARALVVTNARPAKSEEQKSGGQDSTFLEAALSGDDPEARRRNLLPLAVGNSWNFTTVSNEKRSEDRLVVLGQRTEGGTSGIQVNILRGGEPWRRDFYRKEGDMVLLAAMKDETSPLMRMSPALPLWKEPVAEGQELSWIGDFKLSDREVWPATGYSRVSGREVVATPAGKFTVYRIDTVLITNKDGKEIRFPMVRWMASGVGFVRRGFADKGKPAFSELTRFDIK